MTFANPDGTLTTEFSTEPVRMRDASGLWVPISTKVSAPAADGSVTVTGNPLRPRFAKNSDAAGAVKVTTPRGHSLSMTLNGGKRGTAKVSGSEVAYAGVLPGTTLSYEVLPGGVKESIIVSDASRSSWSFRVDLSGLTPSRDAAGSLVFKDSTGVTQLTIPASLSWDSSGVAGQREPATTSARLSYAPDGSGWLVTVSVDPVWLADPARVFPVTVDPTVSYAPDSGTGFKSDGSTCAVSSCGLQVGNPNEAAGTKYWRTVFHVPYEKLAGKHVTAAALKVTVTAGTANIYGSGTGNPVSLRLASSSAYAGAGTVLATSAVGSSGSFSSSTLTSNLNSWTTGSTSNKSFMLTGWETAGLYTYKKMSATMSITYNSLPGTPSGRSLAPCGTACSSPYLTNSTTPKLSATSKDADGGNVRNDFEVWAGSSASPSTKVVSGSAGSVASGSAATWTVPSGKLSNGSTYEFRVRAYDGTDYGAWTSTYSVFTVDTTAPPAPVVSSTTWAAGQWSLEASGTVSWASAATDVASYSYQVDGGAWSAASTAKSVALANLADNAQHKVSVKATDKAGNVSPAGSLAFGVGAGGAPSATGPGGLFVPVQGRILDTRDGTGGYSTPMPVNGWRTVQVTGVAGIPVSGVSAVQVLATVSGATGSGSLYGEPSGGSEATALLSFGGAGATAVSNSGVLAVGADGKIAVAAQGAVDVVIDVQGYYTAGDGTTAPGGFSPVAGARIVDTRAGSGALSGGSSLTVQATGVGGVPVGAQAVFVDLTFINNTSVDGDVKVCPAGAGSSATVIHFPGGANPDSVGMQVGLSPGGAFTVTMGGGGAAVDLLVDVEGYFTAGSATGTFTPAAGQLFDSRVAPQTSVAPGETVTVPVSGVGGVPDPTRGMSAVVVNLTVLAPAGAAGTATVWADGTAEPATIMTSYLPGGARSNLVTSALGVDGAIEVHNVSGAAVDFVVGLEGWYTAPSSTLCPADTVSVLGEAQVGAEFGDPVLSAVLVNSFGSPVAGEITLADSAGRVVGAAPTAVGEVESGTRIVWHVPADAVTAGDAYTWWVHAFVDDGCAPQATGDERSFVMGAAPDLSDLPPVATETVTIGGSALAV
ncbi:MAG: hypothetical protein FWD74_11695, partial [Actinomycetia bacterium]|nr:hypothetical protein [Actinomycetes bacterium]